MLSEKLIFLSTPENLTMRDNGTEYKYYHNTELQDLVYILRTLQTKSIVDLGCGAGLLMAQVRCELPALNVFGFDNEDQLLDIAKQLIECSKKNIMDLSEKDIREYDTLYTWCPFKTFEVAKSFSVVLINCMHPGQRLISYDEGGVYLSKILESSEQLQEIKNECSNFRIFSKI